MKHIPRHPQERDWVRDSSIYVLMTEDPEIILGIYFLMTEDPEIIPGIYVYFITSEYPKIIPGIYFLIPRILKSYQTYTLL